MKHLDGPRYRLVEKNGKSAIYLTEMDIRIATFSPETRTDAKFIVNAANAAVKANERQIKQRRAVRANNLKIGQVRSLPAKKQPETKSKIETSDGETTNHPIP
ncbi:MAG: hypothetical protein ISR52_07100 [Rhodospirillales bacterium]|nr:hypothetical protein [Rhodospirillales bacterium]